jgi:nucleoside-diphosphate-sugar epimerase
LPGRRTLGEALGPNLTQGMKIAITGGGGFLGRKLARELLALPQVERLTLADTAFAAGSEGDPRVDVLTLDLGRAGAAEAVAKDADLIFHLAAVLSGQSETDFDLGMRINVDATRRLLEAARAGGRRPRFVFTSSLAVYGPPLPPVVTKATAVHPQSSYGAAKAIAELLVADYSRRGFIDGRVLRLPTICVRPGRPNGATSSFVSGIIREPLLGEPAACPVSPQLELWLSSPSCAVRNLVHGAFLAPDALGADRILNVPGITISVAGMIEALRRTAGHEAAARITFAEDPLVRRIVSSWPARFDVGRALGLGFACDPAFESLIEEFKAHLAAEGGAARR